MSWYLRREGQTGSQGPEGSVLECDQESDQESMTGGVSAGGADREPDLETSAGVQTGKLD